MKHFCPSHSNYDLHSDNRLLEHLLCSDSIESIDLEYYVLFHSFIIALFFIFTCTKPD